MRRIPWIGLVAALWLSGTAVPPAHGKGAVKVTFTTAPVPAPNNTYSPNNAVAVWIVNAAGQLVRTIGQWVQIRQQHLVAWRNAAGPLDADGISGASRQDHAQPLTAVWNLRDRTGAATPNGTYTIRMELASSNATTAAQNNQGTFTFQKGATPRTQTGLANGRYTSVTIEYDPDAITCADGVVDDPETCDPMISTGAPGACPTSCAAAGDACVANTLVGSPAACTAECVLLPVTRCINGDGCCPAPCSEATDDDCEPGGGGGGGGDDGTTEVQGGCSAGHTGSLLVLAVLLVLSRSTRRRGA